MKKSLSVLILILVILLGISCSSSKSIADSSDFTFVNDCNTEPYIKSVADKDNPATFYDEKDEPSSFKAEKEITVELLATKSAKITTSKGTKELGKKDKFDDQGFEIEFKDSGIKIKVTKENRKLTLTGNYDARIEISSKNDSYVVLDNLNITNANEQGTALMFSGKAERVFLQLEGTNTIEDSVNNTKKGVLRVDTEDEGKEYFQTLIICGDGTLNINANAKHGIDANYSLKIDSGNLNVNVAGTSEGDAVHVADSFVMDEGSVYITTNNKSSMGIKVNGAEADGSLRKEAKGYIAINGGLIDINGKGKGISANWQLKDAQTQSSGDDPDSSLYINNGFISIKAIGNPIDDPEALEAKNNVFINGGLIQLYSNDDGVSAGKLFEMNDGILFAFASNDGVDVNGTKIAINGGTLIAIGGQEGVDIDRNFNLFEYNGGTIITLCKWYGSNKADAGLRKGQYFTQELSDKDASVKLTDTNKSIVFNIPVQYRGTSYLLIATDKTNWAQTKLITSQRSATGDMFNGLIF